MGSHDLAGPAAPLAHARRSGPAFGGRRARERKHGSLGGPAAESAKAAFKLESYIKGYPSTPYVQPPQGSHVTKLV